MLSTFHGIEVGKKGLIGNNMGIETVGHNMSNVSTEGFSRQRVNLKTFHPIYEPSANRVETPGQIGTGVVVENIERVRDLALDDRINFEKGGLGKWDIKQQFLHQVEMILNEPGKPNIRTAMDLFWESWQKVSLDPSDRASREELVQRSIGMTNIFNHNLNSLKDLRNRADLLVNQRIEEINNIAKEIASLNVQIVKSEAVGDSPNDLYDRRDLLVDRLSKIVDIRLERTNKKELIIYIGSENLVQGPEYNLIYASSNNQNEGYVDPRWADGRLVRLGDGELSGLIEARDVDIFDAINNIDSLAINIMDSVNEIHKDGFGLNLSTNNNFFKESPLSPYADGKYDFNNDGIPDGVAIFKIAGTESLNENTIIGSSGYLNFGKTHPNGNDIIIRYESTDTIKDIIDRINRANAGVVAYLNHKNQLTFKATHTGNSGYKEFVIRKLEDSGNLLIGIAGILNQSGAEGAYNFDDVNAITKLKVPEFNITFSPQKNPALWFSVEDKIIYNPENIAVAGGRDTTGDGDNDTINGFGDNRNALLIANLRHKNIMIEKQSTAGDFIKAIVGDFGSRSEAAKQNYEKNNIIVQSLENLRKQISGVNIDEELTKMLMYQHGYNASARLINVVDRMIETVIRLGS